MTVLNIFRSSAYRRQVLLKKQEVTSLIKGEKWIGSRYNESDIRVIMLLMNINKQMNTLTLQQDSED